jgi:DNA-binding SARP family transcriptional activator/predicted ATPase
VPDAVLRVELLGGFRLSVAVETSSRAQSLLAYLALHAGEWIPRRRLAFVFWPDSSEAQARTNLRQLLHHLRSAWPQLDAYIESSGQNLRWRADAAFTLDTAQLESALDAASEAMARRDTSAAVRACEEALALCRGELLPGLYDEWIEPERARFRQLHARALGCLVSLHEQAGNYEAAAAHAEALIELDPLGEPAWQKLIRLYALNGDRASAFRAYERCAATLRRELNAEPGAATRQACDEAAAVRPAPAPRPLAAGFVGRAREWSALVEVWRAASGGRASFALVTGEAGIGKTTLVRELMTVAAGEGAAAEAACYASERPMAYAVIAQWLRAGALAASVAALGAPHRAQLSRVLPEILHDHPGLAPPQPFTESWQRHHFFEALARAVWNAPQPLLLFLDDLQWCDVETLEWLQYVLRARPAARLMIAATARFEEVDRDGPLARAAARLLNSDVATEIAVDPLSAGETAELAARISATSVDAEPLYCQTGGNPLFIVETVRAGMVASHKVQAVITTRLGQLSLPARELATEAAAIGRPFTVDLLAAAGLGDETTIAVAIDELFARRIVHTRDERTYDFSHGQLREVAYGQLGPARRRLIHRRIAQALERTGDAAEASEIASHYERAGDTAIAIAHWERAAAHARRRYAEDEAIAHLTRALKLLETVPPGRDRDRLELNLLVALGPPLMATQGYAAPDVGRVYARSRMLAELAGDTVSALPVLCGSFAFHVVKGEFAASQEIAARFLRLATGNQAEPAALATGLFCLGCTFFYQGRVREAEEKCRSSLEQYAARSAAGPYFGLGPELSVFCRSHLAHALWFLGRPDSALREIEATIATATELSHPFSLALALAYAAMLHQFRDEPSEAERRAAEVADLCRKYDFLYYLSWTPIIGGWAQARAGNQAGLDKMRAGLAALQATGANLRLPYYLMLLGRACRDAGRRDEAMSYVGQGLAVCGSSGEQWVQSELERVKGDLLLDARSQREARASYHAALRTAREQGALVFELRAAKALACLGNANEQVREVLARFEEGFETADYVAARTFAGS